jgi:hypothetical protein
LHNVSILRIVVEWVSMYNIHPPHLLRP